MKENEYNKNREYYRRYCDLCVNNNGYRSSVYKPETLSCKVGVTLEDFCIPCQYFETRYNAQTKCRKCQYLASVPGGIYAACVLEGHYADLERDIKCDSFKLINYQVENAKVTRMYLEDHGYAELRQAVRNILAKRVRPLIKTDVEAKYALNEIIASDLLWDTAVKNVQKKVNFAESVIKYALDSEKV